MLRFVKLVWCASRKCSAGCTPNQLYKSENPSAGCSEIWLEPDFGTWFFLEPGPAEPLRDVLQTNIANLRIRRPDVPVGRGSFAPGLVRPGAGSGEAFAANFGGGEFPPPSLLANRCEQTSGGGNPSESKLRGIRRRGGPPPSLLSPGFPPPKFAGKSLRANFGGGEFPPSLASFFFSKQSSPSVAGRRRASYLTACCRATSSCHAAAPPRHRRSQPSQG